MSRDALASKLTLTVAGSAFDVPAGNLKRFSFHWDAHGFNAEAEWWLVSLKTQSEDTLFDSFTTDTLMEVSLHVEQAFEVPDDTAQAIVLAGIAVDKWVEEHAFADIADAPVLQRRYGVRFRDRLSALWSQHFPCALYTQKALKDVMAANLPQGATLTCTWPALDSVYPVVSLGLGQDGHRVSFHDFVQWLCWRDNGYLQYDAGKDEYELKATRAAVGTTAELDQEDIASVRNVFSECLRAAPSVLNASTLASSKSRSIDNSLAEKGVQSQFLMRSALAADFDSRVTLETARAKQRKPELVLTLARYPQRTLWPATTHKPGQSFSTKLFGNGREYWVRSFSMSAVAVAEDALSNLEDSKNTYDTNMTLCLEQLDDELLRPAPFDAPHWPMLVEGIVVSDVGEQDQGTYQVKVDENTSLDYYRVKIPVFADQEIIASFDAAFMPGHFYFPAFRDQRVLIALDFLGARVVRFIDFRPDGRLAADTQGNHLLMGKKLSDGTSFKHTYRDQKPVLAIQRVLDKDTQLISVSDGTILLKTEEASE